MLAAAPRATHGRLWTGARLLLALPCLTGLVLTVRSVGVILGAFE